MLSFFFLFFFFSSSLWRVQNFFSGKCHRKSIPSTLPDFFLLSLQICSFCLALPLPLCAGFSLNIHQELSLSLLACLDFMTTTCWFFLTLPCIETLLGSARLFFSFLTRSRLRAVDFLECSSLIKKKKKTLPLYVLTFAVQTERMNTTSADHLNVNDTRWMSLVDHFDIKPWNTAHIFFSVIQKDLVFSRLEKKKTTKPIRALSVRLRMNVSIWQMRTEIAMKELHSMDQISAAESGFDQWYKKWSAPIKMPSVVTTLTPSINFQKTKG